MGIFFHIWSILFGNANLTRKEIKDAIGREFKVHYNQLDFDKAIAHLCSYNLITGEHGQYTLNTNRIIYDATPRKIDGIWGASIKVQLPHALNKKAIFICTTKSGTYHAPKIIQEVVKSYRNGESVDYHVFGTHMDTSSGNSPQKDNSQQPKQDFSKPTKKEMKDFMDKFMKHENKQNNKQKSSDSESQAPKPSNSQMKNLKDQIQKDIEKTIQEEVEKRVKPMVIEVKAPDKDTVKIEGAHYLFPRLLRLVSAGFNVFMWGPPGTGKTTAALQVAEALTRKAEIDTLDPTTARSMIQGYMNPNGEPVHNVFTRCWENGSVYVADEVDLAPGHVQTLFNSALANNAAPLAWGNVSRSEGFSFVATGNTAGRPTAAFPDRRPMSNAFADRLYFLHWPLDPSIECRAVGLPTPPLPKQSDETCDAKDWVTFVQLLREWASTNAPRLSITPRASLLGIKALAAGESPEDVADGLIFRGCDKDLRDKALRNIHW